MSTDSRGIQRGRCNNGACGCDKYMGGSTGLKCMRCKHPPGKHENLSAPTVYSSPSAVTAGTGINSQTYSYAGAVNSGTNNYGNTGYSSSSTYYNDQQVVASPYQYPMCAAEGCNNPAYFDNAVGFFDYCTPECRNRDLLPKERKRLEDDLKSFYDNIRASTVGRDITPPGGGSSYSSGFSSGPRPSQPYIAKPTSTVSHTNYTTPTGGGSPGSSSAIKPSQTHSTGQGKQITWQVQFQKSQGKDLGLILSEEKFRRDNFSGLLVLGVEYNTKAIHLLEKGEIHLLDVVTDLNGEETSPYSYSEKIKKAKTVSLTLNRSIALPSIEKLLDKAESLRPTHVFVVMNPKDMPMCSVEKGFGLDTREVLGKVTVTAVRQNTPARISGLKYNDEIIALAFADIDSIDVQMGSLKTDDIATAGGAGKSLILVVKRG